LFIVVSLFTAYLALLGRAVGSFFTLEGGIFERAALTLGIGLALNHLLVLTGLTFPVVFALGLPIAAWGASRLWTDAAAWPSARRRVRWATVIPLLVVGYVFLIYYFVVLSEPLVRWDARSIWFFHARMIWVDSALRESGGWTHPSIVFSHPDYPKLVPAIAAQLAFLTGRWNEYLPKASLLVILIPLLLWIGSFRKPTLSFLLIVVTCFFSLGAWLWNALMDGYLAIYCAAALLLLGRYFSERRDVDLYSGICALGLAASIKNEGVLFALSVATAVLLLGGRGSDFGVRALFVRLTKDAAFARVVVLSSAPALTWALWQKMWGLQNDLAAPGALARATDRLFDGFSPQYLLAFLVSQATGLWVTCALVAGTALFTIYRKITLQHGALVAAGASILYATGLYAAYLSTPYGLNFHLTTSATRTMTTANMALIVSVFFLLTGLEKPERRLAQRPSARSADGTILARVH
jgi:hypothetical protein